MSRKETKLIFNLINLIRDERIREVNDKGTKESTKIKGPDKQSLIQPFMPQFSSFDFSNPKFDNLFLIRFVVGGVWSILYGV